MTPQEENVRLQQQVNQELIAYMDAQRAATKETEKAAEVEAKVKELEGRQAEVVKVIETKVITKIKTVEVVKEVIKTEIIEKEKLINANCDVSPDAIEMFNKSVTNPELLAPAGEAK